MEDQNKILVSIVIPCYNHGQFLQQTLDSIQQNNDDDFYEIIIVNDGSTETETVEKLRLLEARGCHVINQNNAGLSAARNAGVLRSKGKYILPVDADNMIKPDYYRKGISLMEKDHSIDIVYSDAILFGERNEVRISGEFDLGKIVAGNYIDACAIYRKEVWQKNGGYDVGLPYGFYEDWEFWLNAAKHGSKFYYLNEPLFFYRVNSTGLLSIGSDPVKRNSVVNHIAKKNSDLFEKHYQSVIASLHGALANWESRQAEMLKVEKEKT